MSDLPRCYNCRFADEAYKYKTEDDFEVMKGFVKCLLSGCFMWRFDYCTQHPDIQREVERLKNEKQK